MENKTLNGSKGRNPIASQTKVQIAMEAMMGLRTKAEIAESYGVSTQSVALWAAQFKTALPGIFEKPEDCEEDGAGNRTLKIANVSETEVRIERKLDQIARGIKGLKTTLDSQ